jgi:hypothetical protein
MLSLSYSNNIAKLLNDKVVRDIGATEEDDYENSNNNLKMNIVKLKSDIKNSLTTPAKNDELNKMETTINEIDSEEPEEKESPPYIPIDIKPADAASQESQESVPYAPGSPAYEGNTTSEEYQPGSSSPYVPDMDLETTPILIKRPQPQPEQTTGFNPMTPSDSPPTPTPTPAPEEKKTILEVEEKKEETPSQGNSSEGAQGNNGNGDTVNSTSSSSSNETKKIII